MICLGNIGHISLIEASATPNRLAQRFLQKQAGIAIHTG
jgi:hypothetical protein